MSLLAVPKDGAMKPLGTEHGSEGSGEGKPAAGMSHEERLRIQHCHPSMWIGGSGRRHREAEAVAAKAAEAHAVATAHRLDPYSLQCTICGVSEVAIEARRYEGGILCVPDLVLTVKP